MRTSRLAHDLTELAWVVLLIDVIVLLTGSLIATYIGRMALVLSGAFAALITLTMATLALANLLLIGALRLRDRRAKALRSTVSQ